MADTAWYRQLAGLIYLPARQELLREKHQRQGCALIRVEEFQ